MTRSSMWGLCASFISSVFLIGAYIWQSEESSFVANETSLLTKASCWMDVHEDFTQDCFQFLTQPDKQFRLPIRILKNNRARASTLVVHVPGGPGQGRLADDIHVDFWVGWLLDQNVSVDMLFYDPRGTWGAKPNMVCENYTTRIRELLARSPELEEEYSLLNKELGACWDRYRKGFDEPFRGARAAAHLFSSHVQAQDIINIISYFDYDKVVLWGVSYGTRVALLAANHPSVDGLVLDAVYPFEVGKVSDWIGVHEESFVQQETLYQVREEKLFPTYAALFDQAYEALKKSPRTIPVEHWDTGRKLTFVLNSTRLIDVAFSLGYVPELYEDFYSGLETFVEENTISSELTGVVEGLYNNILADDFSPLTYFLVECVDNFQEEGDIIEDLLAHQPYLKAYFGPALDHDACQYLNIPALDGGIHEASYTDKPTVVFTGEYDYVTPKSNVEKLAKGITGPMPVIEMPKTGHGSAHVFESCDWNAIFTFASGGERNGTPFCSEFVEWQ